MMKTKEKTKVKGMASDGRLVSAAEVVRALPEFFSERNQVLRLAQRRVIPCYVFPGTGRTRRGEYRFVVKEVRKVLRGYYQPEV